MDPKDKKQKKSIKINFKSMFGFLGSDADKDWKFIGIFMGSILIVIMIINALLFFRYAVSPNDKSVERSEFELIDRQKLTEVIERFDKRTEEFKKVKEDISLKK